MPVRSPYTHIHTYIYTHTHIHIYIYTHTHIPIFIIRRYDLGALVLEGAAIPIVCDRDAVRSDRDVI